MNGLKEGGSNMKLSKGISLLVVAFVMLLAFPVQGLADTSEWVSADDGAAEVRFISWEAGTYPEYKLNLQFRLDQSQESNIWSFTFNIKNESSANNRRVKAACSGKIEAFTCVSETTYKVRLPYTMGEKEKYMAATIDLALVFPEDFINSDALITATCLKNLLNLLGNPSEYSFSDFSMMRSKKDDAVYFYTFSFTAPNKSGGKTTVTVDANYNVSDGSAFFSLPETDQLFHVGENWLGQLPMLTEMVEIYDEAVTIPASSVLIYVK